MGNPQRNPEIWGLGPPEDRPLEKSPKYPKGSYATPWGYITYTNPIGDDINHIIKLIFNNGDKNE